MELENVKVSSVTDKIIKVAAIVGAILVIINAYKGYKSSIFVPKVTVKDKDFDKGEATVVYDGTEIPLKGDATYLVSGNWGSRLGQTNIDGGTIYDRIELLKNGMVYSYLKA